MILKKLIDYHCKKDQCIDYTISTRNILSYCVINESLIINNILYNCIINKYTIIHSSILINCISYDCMLYNSIWYNGWWKNGYWKNNIWQDGIWTKGMLYINKFNKHITSYKDPKQLQHLINNNVTFNNLLVLNNKK